MESIVFAANQYLELLAYVFLGYLLRRFGLFKESDGETALRFAKYVTVPAVIVSTLGDVTLQRWMLVFPAVALGYALLSGLAMLAMSWGRPRRERAQLLGSSVGAGVGLVGYPFIEATFGPTGLLAAILFDIPNMFVKNVLSYLLFSTAGPVFPDKYVHDDAGVYSGEWRGTSKEGLGVYTYPSGAKYEGEWRDNLKQGRGVYYYPKGGLYEGEWLGGSPDGIGVRTLSSGQVKAGRWAQGKLVEPLELWQCANAVQGATEAAEASRRLEVGGASPKEAAARLLRDPSLVVALGVIALAAVGLDVPMAIESVALSLSAANKCLVLMAVGIMLKQTAQPRQYPDILKVLSARYLPALAVGVVLPFANSAFHFNEFPAATLVVAFTLVIMLCMLSPVPRESVATAKRFRLGLSYAEALYQISAVASMALFTAIGLVSYVAAGAGVYELVNWTCAGLALALVAITAGVTVVTQRKVRMTLDVAGGADASKGVGKPATGTAAVRGPSPDAGGIRSTRPAAAPRLGHSLLAPQPRGAVRRAVLQRPLLARAWQPRGAMMACL